MPRVVFALIVATFTLGGCHTDRSIIGTWRTRAVLAEPMRSAWKASDTIGTMTFAQDGTYTSDSDVGLHARKVRMHVQENGTWKLRGDKLQFHCLDLDQGFKGLDAEKNTKLIQKQKERNIEIRNNKGPSVVTWSGDNSFTLTDERGNKTECTRQK